MERRSITQAIWHDPAVDSARVDGLVDATGMPIAVAIIAAGRGLKRDTIEGWLAPKIRDLMPDPSTMTDMDKLVARLVKAVENKEKIGIFGDYDVDGACSATLLHDILTPLGCEISIHIPDRMDEGYGPNLPALLKLKAEGCNLIITVDCGITAHAPIAGAVEQGVDVLIIDHHIAGPDLPRAHAVVNPNRLEEDGSLGYLSAAGVCFMVMAGLLRVLRQSGMFEETDEPNLKASLDLVALATICDMVPLLGLNRALVRTGLAVMAERNRQGVAALADSAKLDRPPDTQALSHILGPRLNAGGRIGDSSMGVNLLTTKNETAAAQLAEELDALNTRRKEIEQTVTAESLAQLENCEDLVVIAKSEGWQEGVIGIVAARIKSALARPAAVISIKQNEQGRQIGKGSARSLAPFNIGGAIIAAQQSGLLIAGGGHNMAAGFTLDMANFEAFQLFMNKRATQEFGESRPTLKRNISAPLGAGEVNLGLLDWLERLGPYGAGFPEPLFLLSHAKLGGVRSMGSDGIHRAMRLSDQTGSIRAVAFNVGGTPLAELIESAKDGRPMDILGKISKNTYQGKVSAQFIIKDIR